MFPPVEDAVFQHNPEFAALYKTLTTAILNPDGSTKNDPAAKERNAVRAVCAYLPYLGYLLPHLPRYTLLISESRDGK